MPRYPTSAMPLAIDLNADLGESYGPWLMGADAALLDLVSSANIACGLHAGDWDVMARTVALASAKGVALGAHPGLPDRQGFGRRELALCPDEAHNLVLYQLGALAGFARAAGAALAHVKPHGALYHMAARDRRLADAIAAAVRGFDPGLALVGPPGSALLDAGRDAGLAVWGEAFADRRYRADGTLLPRREPKALIRDVDEAVAQALSLVETGTVVAADGTRVAVAAQTLCLHGDSPEALVLARRLRAELAARGIAVRAPERQP